MFTVTDQDPFFEFSKARWRSRRKGLVNRLRSENLTLREMAQTLNNKRVVQQHDGGIHDIDISKIVGSIGRAQDFDRDFMPANDHVLHRWVNIDRIYHDGVGLPAIEVFKLGDEYFVEDGHHRVSVAKFHGQKYIDAHVIEIKVA